MKTEGTGNKVVLIVLLCAALALFLYIRPLIFAHQPPPTLVERLPESELIGRYNLLEIAKETQSLMFKNKVPFREYFTADFILGQAKSIGVDIQSTGYFFSDGEEEWGTFVSVLDSSRIQSGFERMEQYLKLSDTLVFQRKIKKIDDLNLYIFYDNNYMFVYHGKKFKRRLAHALFAKFGEQVEVWKQFLKKKTFVDEKIVLFSSSDKLKKFGLEYVMFAHDSDSLNIKLKSYLRSSKRFDIKEKENGISYVKNPTTTKSLELHLDISEFRKNTNSELYKWVVQMGKKVSFPTKTFFDAWEGDLSLQEGGLHTVNQELIELEYDEEFNPVEVKKTKQIQVRGYSIILSVNQNGKKLVNALFAKGIITKQDKSYRFLFSPPLNLNILPNSISAYTTPKPPKKRVESKSYGVWRYNNTDVYFQIDSLKSHEAYGSLEFEVSRFIKRGKISF